MLPCGSPCGVLGDGEGHDAVAAHNADGGPEANHAVHARGGQHGAARLTAHRHRHLKRKHAE